MDASQAQAALARSYDSAPYASWPLPNLQPGRLAAIAHLLGLTYAEPAKARVLEIGCASGGHLLPLAYASPQARFVGLDISPVQIRDGQERAKRLGLANVDLQCRSLTELGAADGLFDYIVCHGVYSWVPEAVREALLAACHARLAPQGIAVVSYNVLPGWRLFQAVRDALLLHAGDAATPAERAAKARQLFALMRGQAPLESTYGQIWRDEAEKMAKLPDFYLEHEIFASDNAPVHFRDFAQACIRHGLAYLGETSLRSMIPETFGAGAAEAIRALSGDELIAAEQYGDIFSGRTFRQTLLVHAGRAGEIDRGFDAGRLAGLHFTAAAGFRIVPGEGYGFLSYDDGFGEVSSTDDPAVARAIGRFVERLPGSSSLDDLAEAGERETVASAFMAMLLRNQISASVLPVLCAAGPIARPRAFWPAASDAAAGAGIVATPRHEKLALDSMSRLLLPLCDGTRGRDDLIGEVFRLAASGAMQVRDAAGALIEDEARLRAIAANSVDAALRGLARAGVFVG